jgi:cell division septation protein DedD
MGTLTYLGDEEIDVPILRRTVKKGDTFDVADDLLDTPDLVWPAATWQVNGASHAFDLNSPENVAKAESDRVKAEADAAAAAPAPEAPAAVEPVTVSPVDSPVPLDNPAPAAETTVS